MKMEINGLQWVLLLDSLDALAKESPKRKQECDELTAYLINERDRSAAEIKSKPSYYEGYHAASAYGMAVSAEEQTEFDVILVTVPSDFRLRIIKKIRELKRNVSLAEAVAYANKAPTKLFEGVSRYDAGDFCKMLREAGAVVEMR